MQGLHARGRVYATGGRVDPSTVIDLAAHRRDWSRQAMRERAALEAEQQDAKTYARMVMAFNRAPKGDAKRAALVAMRAYEQRTGRLPYAQPECVRGFALSVDTAEGTGMGERK